MDFFNKAKESLKNAGAVVSQKASDVSSSMSLAMKNKDLEKELKECYADIAKIMVEEHFDELNNFCPELCDRIKGIKEQIEQNKKEMASTKGAQEEVKKEDNQKEDNQEESEIVCAECGQKFSGGLFCPNCGKKAQ